MRYSGVLLSVVIALLTIGSAQAQFSTGGLEGHIVEDLKLQGDHLFAATDSGLYRTDLAGGAASWTRIGFEGDHVTHLLPLSPDTLLAGTQEHRDTQQDSVFLFRSVDGGATWTAFQNGFGSDTKTRRVTDMEAAGVDKDTLFATNGYHIFKSTDKGTNWQKVYQYSSNFHFVTTAYFDGPYVYAGGQSGFGNGVIWRTDDGGESWEGLPNSDQWSSTYSDLAVFSAHPDSLVSTGHGSVWVSGNRGNSWSTKLYAGRYDFKKVTASPSVDGTVYAAGHSSSQWWNNALALFKSTDSGEDWGVVADSTLDVNDVRALAIRSQTNPETVYLGTESGVYSYDNTTAPTPYANRPMVNILTPEDGSDQYYVSQTDEWYQGIELSFEGGDADGQIIEYGWALGQQDYTWTTDTSLTLSPDVFEGPGTYSIRVTARDDDDMMAVPDTTTIHLVEPTREQRILIVDGTDESKLQSKGVSLTDHYIDSLYHTWVGPRGRSYWDIEEQGLPSRGELGKYKLVIWHADHWYGNSSNAHNILMRRKHLADYMDVGGDVLLTGWKVLSSLYPAEGYPIEFDSTDFARKYFGIRTASSTGASPPGDVVGAIGVGEFPDIEIDSSRTEGYPAGFYTNLVDVAMVEARSETATSLLTLRCRPECSNALLRGQPVAQVNNEQHFMAGIFGFPLTFMKEDQAGSALLSTLIRMGYMEMSIPSDEEQPKHFALRPNYPNPFNPTTRIRFALPKAAEVQLSVYNVTGRKVATLVDERMNAGRHRVTFDGSGLASGIYIYRLQSDGFVQSRKMLLMK